MLLFEPFIIPVVLLAIFLKNLFVQHVKQDLLRGVVADDTDEVLAVFVINYVYAIRRVIFVFFYNNNSNNTLLHENTKHVHVLGL